MAATTKTTTTKKKKRRKKRKNDFDDDITNNVSSEKETTKKRKRKGGSGDDDDDVGELLVKMYPHGSFLRPLFVHRQTQKDIRDIREEEDDEEDKEEEKATASSASFAAATVLVTGFPFEWHNEFSIQDLFSTSVGETKRVQLIRFKNEFRSEERFGDVRTDQEFTKVMEENRREDNRRSTDNDENRNRLTSSSPVRFG